MGLPGEGRVDQNHRAKRSGPQIKWFLVSFTGGNLAEATDRSSQMAIRKRPAFGNARDQFEDPHVIKQVGLTHFFCLYLSVIFSDFEVCKINLLCRP